MRTCVTAIAAAVLAASGGCGREGTDPLQGDYSEGSGTGSGVESGMRVACAQCTLSSHGEIVDLTMDTTGNGPTITVVAHIPSTPGALQAWSTGQSLSPSYDYTDSHGVTHEGLTDIGASLDEPEGSDMFSITVTFHDGWWSGKATVSGDNGPYGSSV